MKDLFAVIESKDYITELSYFPFGPKSHLEPYWCKMFANPSWQTWARGKTAEDAIRSCLDAMEREKP